MNALLLLSMLSLSATESDVRPEDVLQFFPTAAKRSADGQAWIVPVRGIVFTPDRGGLTNHAMLGVFRRVAGIDKEDAEGAVFQARARAFLVDNQGKREIFIRLGGTTHPVGTSEANGHFQTSLTIPIAEVDALQKALPANAPKGWLDWEAVLPEKDSRRIAGRAQLIAPRGVSIISDIDDTIKISQVTNRKELLRNTFARPFEPVPGMAKWYARWSDQGAVFHYVSASPWQLYPPLEEFLAENKFPRGPWELRHFRWKDSSAADLLGSKIEYKTEKIEPLLAAYPDRTFICVGDSGEQDPETYGLLARKYPKQVAKIYIRNVNDGESPTDRARQAFADVPEAKWKIFRNAEELDGEKLPATE